MSASTVYYPDATDVVSIRSYIHTGEQWVTLNAPGVSILANGPERIAQLRKIAEQLLLACDAAADAETHIDHDITDQVLVTR